MRVVWLLMAVFSLALAYEIDRKADQKRSAPQSVELKLVELNIPALLVATAKAAPACEAD